MSDLRRGTLYGAAAYLLWGLFPLYWPLLAPAGALEILAHRFVWSLVVVVGILAVQRNLGWWRTIAADRRRLGLLSIAAVVIAANWVTYIVGVNTGHVVETSLGYFINPLVTVLLGVLVLRETLRRPQWIAMGIAAVAVAVLTIDYGRLPWIALVLAASFGTYGLLKKQAAVGAVESLAVETGVLFLPALAFLAVLHGMGRGTLGDVSPLHTTLLVGAGVVTVVPLLFFGAAATRVPLTTLGLLQYLAPTLQFLFGVVVYREALPPSRLAGFVLVWIALLIFTVDSLAHRRRAMRLAVEAVT